MLWKNTEYILICMYDWLVGSRGLERWPLRVGWLLDSCITRELFTTELIHIIPLRYQVGSLLPLTLWPDHLESSTKTHVLSFCPLSSPALQPATFRRLEQGQSGMLCGTRWRGDLSTGHLKMSSPLDISNCWGCPVSQALLAQAGLCGPHIFVPALPRDAEILSASLCIQREISGEIVFD